MEFVSKWQATEDGDENRWQKQVRLHHSEPSCLTGLQTAGRHDHIRKKIWRRAWVWCKKTWTMKLQVRLCLPVQEPHPHHLSVSTSTRRTSPQDQTLITHTHTRSECYKQCDKAPSEGFRQTHFSCHLICQSWWQCKGLIATGFFICSLIIAKITQKISYLKLHA